MNKNKKIDELLAQLDALEGKGGFPAENVESLTKSLINEELSAVTEKIRNNPTIKFLEKINNELIKFRRDFNLNPVIESVKGLSAEITQNNQSLISDFESKISGIKVQMSKVKDDSKQLAKLSQDLVNLKTELSSALESISREEELVISELRKDIGSFKNNLKSIKKELSDVVSEQSSKTKDETEKSMAKVNSRLDQLNISLINKINDISGRGGAMNRKVSINGTVISTKYTDINFLGSGVSYGAVDNNTTKQVDLTLTASGGVNGHVIEDEGTPLPQRANLNFVGAGVVASDDAGNDATKVTINGGAGGSAYQQPLTGDVDGVNKDYTWATEPNAIVVDGICINKVTNKTSGGTTNWTGTTTTSLTIAPTENIFAIG